MKFKRRGPDENEMKIEIDITLNDKNSRMFFKNLIIFETFA